MSDSHADDRRSEADLLLEAAGEDAVRESRAHARARLEALCDEALLVLERDLRNRDDRSLQMRAAREVLELFGVRVPAVPTRALEQTTEPGLRTLGRRRRQLRAGIALSIVGGLGLWLVLARAGAPAHREPHRVTPIATARPVSAPQPSRELQTSAFKPVTTPEASAPEPGRAAELASPPPAQPLRMPERALPSNPAPSPRVRRENQARPAAPIAKRSPLVEVRASGAELASSSEAGLRSRPIGRLGIQMSENDF